MKQSAEKMETVDKKTAWEGKFLRALNLTYIDHNGNSRNWEAVERTNCSGIVSIIPSTTDGKILLIRQFRPVVNNFVIECPAGLIDTAEDPVDSAKRELIEETGYTSDEFIFLAEGPISSGLSTEMLIVYLAKNIIPAPPEIRKQHPPDETENIEIIESSFSTLNETLEAFRKRGDYVDIKIYGLMELAKKHLKIAL